MKHLVEKLNGESSVKLNTSELKVIIHKESKRKVNHITILQIPTINLR